MKKDISNSKDVELLIDSFYDKVKLNPVIGYIFNEVIGENWADHLPVMYRFWENVLFYTGGYTGNPLLVHKHVNGLFPLKAEHFEEWNRLFSDTVDELFAGEKADLAKLRALSISAVMKLEILRAK